MIDEYRRLTEQLVALDTGHKMALADAERAFAVATAPESRDVAEATAVLKVANEAAWSAARRRAHVDIRAERIWAELAALLGRRGRRLGALPDPAADLTFGNTSARAEAATAALERASDTIARSARGEAIGVVPGWALALLPFVGAACALVVAYPMRLLIASHGSLLAQAFVLVAPFAGLPLVAWWARDRFGCPPDGGVMGLTALGGMIAACATALL
jgi:hypothetical protein